MRKRYPTDLSDAEWTYIEAHLPAPKGHGRPRTPSLREILDAIFYLLISGCQWRLLPHDFPRWPTVYWYFRKWRIDGSWERINKALRERLRVRLKRDPQPSAGFVLKAKAPSAKVMVHGGTKPLLPGPDGLFPRLSHLWVDAGYRGEDKGADWVRKTLGWSVDLVERPRKPAPEEVLMSWAKEWAKEGVKAHWEHLLPPKGFRVLPRRWVVERTI